jgi:hypothetical protein
LTSSPSTVVLAAATALSASLHHADAVHKKSRPPGSVPTRVSARRGLLGGDVEADRSQGERLRACPPEFLTRTLTPTEAFVAGSARLDGDQTVFERFLDAFAFPALRPATS